MGKSLIIVGAGEFGLSLALELSRKNGEHEYSSITILDREMPPVFGGASVDISRIMRPDYADPKYTAMGMEALKEWQTSTLYRDHFYQSEIIMMAHKESNFRDRSIANLNKLGLPTYTVDSSQDARAKYPSYDGILEGSRGYAHENAGWVNAEGTVRSTVGEILKLGKAQFVVGDDGTMVELIKEGNRIAGVKTKSSKIHLADTVVMATGSWTSSLVDFEDRFVATGQPVGFMQLSPEETRKYSKNPVYFNISTGVFVFPPTPDGVLKCARHGFGYTRTLPTAWGKGTISTAPQTPIENELPQDAIQALRKGIRESYGDAISKRPFYKSRLCWYNDTPDGDFVFSYHPHYKNLFLCTGGCGHAFKFFPVLGRYSAGCLLKTLDKEWLDKFALKDQKITPDTVIDGGRGIPWKTGPGRQELKNSRLSKL
ncbi:hypothetical protein TRICI_005456 [Trichomonascus ciferrii]|uniref:FAD dependent oxidoreductase domain-containing protein n=1 Tax=Trichomonascus ciferrii TaxID=44093 RepID=A0A642USP0_9ASCO|nr:hypothetical protein TRICI_005456 [Trichomonascus ciferrii]